MPMSVLNLVPLMVAPARERGLKFVIRHTGGSIAKVAPARERGLKFKEFMTAAD